MTAKPGYLKQAGLLQKSSPSHNMFLPEECTNESDIKSILLSIYKAEFEEMEHMIFSGSSWNIEVLTENRQQRMNHQDKTIYNQPSKQTFNKTFK